PRKHSGSNGHRPSSSNGYNSHSRWTRHRGPVRLAAPEIAHVLADSAPRVLVYAAALRDVVETACTGATATPCLFGLDGDGEHSNLLTAGDELAAVTRDRSVESDDAFITYTSGTTGRPKGVLIDHHRAVWAAMAQIVSLGLRDGDRYLHLPPLYHAGGAVFLNATTLLGGTNVLVDRFEPDAVLDAIDQFGVTALLAVPTMYRFMLRHNELAQRDLSTWRIGVFGAAPMPERTVEALLDAFPSVEFFQQCGQTEAGPSGIYSTMAQVRSQPDSSGHLAQPFITARVIDDLGRDVETGAVGELILAGEPIMKGYWGRPAETREALISGWLYTGDLVEVMDDGGMRVVDRRKDVILSGGRNIYSAEVEQALAGHPAVADCAVVGVPHPDWGETVVAVVDPVDGARPTLEELRDHCAGLIADYKLPRRLVLGPVPRNAAGKIPKHTVRAMLTEP
ncbi:class I adenylate-forming enzyme family protein, partial [Nocardia sp. NPDC059239]|uniref:class I adenylate-forming enzyme family protein n=1 Tax=unclassified Nocardia TaxID=2637762 RepID=UPI00367A3A9C